jgi:predicted MFS family arabinose efflux permease
MSPGNRFRALCYVIEGMNSFAITFFWGYLFFFFRDRHGFNDRQNLWLAALAGLVYSVAAWQAGRFAQRRGCFTALRVGFGVMAISLAAGWCWHSMAGEITAACMVNAGVCFIWPSLEALVSEGDAPEHVPHAVGLYNITWALTNAAAFFTGGSLIKTLGYDGLFGLPLALMLGQFGMTYWLEKIHPPPPPRRGEDAGWKNGGARGAARARNFQRMAWLANPSAYIAINTLIAVLPGIALKFHLSTVRAGFALTIWCFARFFIFIALWRWTAWHYRLRWLVTSFALLIISFVTILLAPNLGLVLLAQVIFGMSIGLIYYSSLFYSMDASETKGEQGGIHEAAIGIGNCLGPAMGATALWLAPTDPGIGAWAVSGLLAVGFAGLGWIRWSGRQERDGG